MVLKAIILKSQKNLSKKSIINKSAINKIHKHAKIDNWAKIS